MATDKECSRPGLVSIVMPSYNRAELTRRAVDSVLAQTYKDFQLILVDDGSKDHTRQVFERMPGVEYHHRVNGGQAKATNTGLSLAKGEFIALLDSDDWWGPDFLAESVAALLRTGAGIAFSSCMRIINVPGYDSAPQPNTEKERVLAPYCIQRNGDWYVLDPVKTRELFVRQGPATTSGIVVRREAMLSQICERVKLATDVMLSLELAVKTQLTCAFCLKPLWFKTLHDSNICDLISTDPKVNRRLIEAAVFDGHVMMEKVGTLLTPEERDFIEQRIAKNYFDLGYFESQHGTVGASLSAYWNSMRLRPSAGVLVAMAKSLVRGLKPGAKTAAT